MAAGAFCVGQRLRLGDEACRVMRDLGDGKLILEALQSGRLQERSVPELLQAWQAQDLIFEGPSQRIEISTASKQAYEDAFRQAYSKEAQAEAKAKLVYVTRLESIPRTASIMTPIIEEIWNDRKLWKGAQPLSSPPHFTTVARWIRIYGKAGRDIRALVDRDANKGTGSDRIHPVVRQMVDDTLELQYLTLERPGLAEIWRQLKGQVAMRNATRNPSELLKRPSYGYLKRRVQKLNPYDVCRARYGQRVADIKFRTAGRGVLTQHPLARACMDHTQMDLFVIDEATCLPLGRPWLTLIIDEHSRYVLGYYIGFEPPSSVSMTRALRHAIAPKVLDPEVQNDWDAWGVMELLIVDQALEFHGGILEHGAGRYGINVEYCPRKKPWYKGKIERYFGTLNTGLLASLQGKTFSSIDLRGDYDPAKHAVVTMETLRRIIQIWIVDVYHQDMHRTLGMSPQQAWADGLEHGGDSESPVDRYLPPSSIEVDSAFSASDTRRLTHKGIEFDRLLYNSAELGALREHWGVEFTVEVRTQDDDLGSIVVVAPDSQTLIRVPALDPEYAVGLTRWQHGVCKRYQRNLQDDDAREIGLLEAKRRIRALVEQDMFSKGRKVRSRVRQQRFLESGGSPADEPTSVGQDAPASTPAEDTRTTSNTDTAEPTTSIALGADDDVPDFNSSKRNRKESK